MFTYPKYIIDKESTKKNAACTDPIQLQELHTIEREGQAKQIVRNPVLKTHNLQYTVKRTDFFCFLNMQFLL